MAVNRDTIDQYYQHRELVEPNSTEALLWLITEVAELAQAYSAYVMQYEDAAEAVDDYDRSLGFSAPEYASIQLLIKIRQTLEGALGERRETWVRNNPTQPGSKSDLPGEIADVYMMLDRFCKELGMGEPSQLLGTKMKAKGFDLEKSIGKARDISLDNSGQS